MLKDIYFCDCVFCVVGCYGYWKFVVCVQFGGVGKLG